MHKDIKALFKEYSESAKKKSENLPKATAKELAAYKRIIKKLKTYKKEKRVASPEDWQNITLLFSKMSPEQQSAIEAIPAMPPGPMPPTPEPLENASVELIELKQTFDEASLAYYELVGVYFAGKEIDPKQLWALYDEAMNLYDNYIKRYNKQSKPSKK